MSPKQGDNAPLIQRVERGRRVKEIREALELSGDQFAAQLSAQAKAFGVRAHYDKSKVSKIETGGRKLTVEEAAIISGMDPHERGALWLVFGIRQADKNRFRKLG